MPRDGKRFEAYLSLLQGNTKADMVVPVMGYNPMGGDHILEKLNELIDLKAEEIAQTVIEAFNKKTKPNTKEEIEVAINLSDDIGGAWTHRSAAEYKSIFEFGPVLKRNFSTPHFWTSEIYDENIIRDRIEAHLWRTNFCLKNGHPKTLKECFEQEVYVALHGRPIEQTEEVGGFEKIKSYLKKNSDSTDYLTIFNFFYGDEAARELGYKTFGLEAEAGFRFAQKVAAERA